MRLYDVIHYRVHVIETPDCVVLVFLQKSCTKTKKHTFRFIMSLQKRKKEEAFFFNVLHKTYLLLQVTR